MVTWRNLYLLNLGIWLIWPFVTLFWLAVAQDSRLMQITLLVETMVLWILTMIVLLMGRKAARCALQLQ